ncbi:MAG: hypothetical protein AAFP90_15820, partial [Planctomycetota bacterium]
MGGITNTFTDFHRNNQCHHTELTPDIPTQSVSEGHHFPNPKRKQGMLISQPEASQPVELVSGKTLGRR